MRIESIKLQNYGVFLGTHEFKLAGKGLTIVLGDNQDEPKMDSNGAGKSTLFDGLDWVLFGVVPRGDNVDSIVNETAGKDCEGEVNLTDDNGVPIMVRRWRKMGKGGNGVMLMVGGSDRTALDPGETQRSIEAQLGLDRDTFHASVLFGQTDLFRFADATDSERMESLTKILQLGQIDEWLERAKAEAAKAVHVVFTAQNDLQRAQGMLVGLQAQNFDAQIAEWHQATLVKAAQLSDQIRDADARVQAMALTVKDPALVQKQLNDLMTVFAPVEPPEMAQARAEIQKITRMESTTHAEVYAAQRQVQTLQATITQMLAKRGGTCGACGQTITAEHIDAEVKRLSDESSLLAARAAEQAILERRATESRVTIEAALASAQAKTQEAMRDHAARMGALNAELAGIQREQTTLQMARAHALRLVEEMAQLQTLRNPFTQKKEEQARDIANVTVGIDTLVKAESAAKEQQGYYDFWVRAFGPSGLKNYILDTKLQAITDAANHWVKMLTGGTIWVRIETQTMGRSTGTLRNKLSVRVFRYMPDGTVRERNYKSWSGGEKQRVSLGIDLGLSSLIAARARKRYDILIMDELFRHLDGAGREATMELLQALAREKSSVFVVDHDADLQAQFERRVTIRKISGRSIILEEKPDDYRTRSHAEAQPQGTPANNDVPARKPRPKRTPVQTG